MSGEHGVPAPGAGLTRSIKQRLFDAAHGGSHPAVGERQRKGWAWPLAALHCCACLALPAAAAETETPETATAPATPATVPAAPAAESRAEAEASPGAGAAAADKSQYHLFHPTPRALMREMVTDRPDKTESPYTLDAGHFQVEMDFLTHARDRDKSNGGDTRVESSAVMPVNLKVGLLNQVDLQLLLDTWNRVRTEDRVAGTVLHQSGFGDVTPRLKVNLWGNDGGKTAMGVMPFVKIPTNQDGLGNDAVEGGVILPLAIELPLGFSAGLMTEYDFMQNAANSRYHPEFINSLTLGHDLVGKLDGYVEFFSQVSSDDGADWVGTIDLGVTCELTPNLQLDFGVAIGVTPAADDLNPFVGLSFRF